MKELGNWWPLTIYNRIAGLRMGTALWHGKTEANQMTADASPHIHKLPLEILSEIFRLCEADQDKMDEHHRDGSETDCSDHTTQVRVLLGQVCLHWRHVAYHLTPGLWRDIHIYFHQCTNVGMSFLNEWASRGNGRIFHLQIVPKEDLHSAATSEPSVFARALLPILQSTEALTLRLPLRYLEALADVISPTAVPFLEELQLDCYTALGLPSRTSASAFSLEGWPRLNSVRLQEVGYCMDPPRFSFIAAGLVTNVPWSQLTALALVEDTTDPIRARQILTDTPNLVSCTLAISGWGDIPSNFHFSETVLKSLTSFDITFSGYVIHPFFESLVLPVLTKLEFGTMDAVHPDTVTGLFTLQEHSRFPLQQLFLLGVIIDSDGFLGFLNEVPTLLTIELSYSNILCFPPFIRALTQSPTDTPLIPRLKTLSIQDFESRTEASVVLDMIESRWRPVPEAAGSGVSRLEEVNIHINRARRYFDPASNQRIQTLKDSGLDLHFMQGMRDAPDVVDDDDSDDSDA